MGVGEAEGVGRLPSRLSWKANIGALTCKMNVLFLYHMLRMNGVGFLRSRYFVEDLEKRGHNVRLAYFIVDDKSKFKDYLQDDVISFDEVSEFRPDSLIFELGSADRFPSREWLNELKRQGCIIVHCGLDYNDYNGDRTRYDEVYTSFGCGIRKKEGDGLELPDIRDVDMVSQVTRTNVETLKEYCSIQEPKVFENVPWVSSHHALVIYPFKHILLTAGPNSFVKAYNDGIHGENYAIYGAFNDTIGIEILITGHFVTDGKNRMERQYNRTFLINVLEYFDAFSSLKYQPKPNTQIQLSEELSEDKRYLYTLLKQHTSNLHKLRERQAKYGIDAPISLLNEIEHEESEIVRIEAELQSLKGPV